MLTALVKGEITNTNSTRQQLSNANGTSTCQISHEHAVPLHIT